MLKKILLLLSITLITLFAQSREEARIKASLYPYTVKNITYYPHKVAIGETHKILASWYGEYFHGRETALGEIYDMNGYSAAHKTYPLGTILRVTNERNGKSLEVKINDRGPFWGKRELDLSKGAATYLGTKEKGVAPVTIEVVSVPSVGLSRSSIKGRDPKKRKISPRLSTDKLAVFSYAYISPEATNVPLELGEFSSLKSVKKYKEKLKNYLSFSYILKYGKFYKVKTYLPSNKKKAKAILRKLKKRGLLSEYHLYWSYK